MLKKSAEFKRFIMLSDFFNTIHCGGANIVMLKYSLVKKFIDTREKENL